MLRFFVNQPNFWNNLLVCIVRNGVPAPPFKVSTPWSSFSPFSKSLVPPPFKTVFQYFPHAIPSYSNPTRQPSLHTINGFKQIWNWWFYQNNCRFLLKINFWFFKSLYKFTNISGYLNLWNIFRFNFRQLRMTFFHKILVAVKSNFSSNAWHNFAKSKVIYNKVIISCGIHQTSAWQHKRLSTRTFRHITKSSSATGRTRRRLLMSADCSCVLQLMMTL